MIDIPEDVFNALQNQPAEPERRSLTPDHIREARKRKATADVALRAAQDDLEWSKAMGATPNRLADLAEGVTAWRLEADEAALCLTLVQRWHRGTGGTA